MQYTRVHVFLRESAQSVRYKGVEKLASQGLKYFTCSAHRSPRSLHTETATDREYVASEKNHESNSGRIWILALAHYKTHYAVERETAVHANFSTWCLHMVLLFWVKAPATLSLRARARSTICSAVTTPRLFRSDLITTYFQLCCWWSQISFLQPCTLDIAFLSYNWASPATATEWKHKLNKADRRRALRFMFSPFLQWS